VIDIDIVRAWFGKGNDWFNELSVHNFSVTWNDISLKPMENAFALTMISQKLNLQDYTKKGKIILIKELLIKAGKFLITVC